MTIAPWPAQFSHKSRDRKRKNFSKNISCNENRKGLCLSLVAFSAGENLFRPAEARLSLFCGERHRRHFSPMSHSRFFWFAEILRSGISVYSVFTK
jgi:hypothetical protein